MADGSRTGRRPPLIVVAGPTAAGKSDLAVSIAEWFGGEVVSSDAFQVYRGLDIGTAKPTPDQMRGVRHHCIDIVDPGERYTAGRYAREAAVAIEGVYARSHIPIVAGGTGFYVRALIDGLAPLPEHDPRWQRALQALLARRGLDHLFAMLRRLDPDWARAVGPGDRQRIARGLEVTLRTGTRMSTLLHEQGRIEPRFDAVWVGLTRPRSLLWERIEARVDEMLAGGWLDEVRGLQEAGYCAASPGLRAIGYREILAHLAGDRSLAETREAIVSATRRYAKRQLTWFRGQTPAVFFEAAEAERTARPRLEAEVRAHLRARLSC